MKVYYICDCCDTVFAEEESQRGVASHAGEALTADEEGDIILDGDQGSPVYVSSVCFECSRELSLDDDTDNFFFRPLLH